MAMREPAAWAATINQLVADTAQRLAHLEGEQQRRLEAHARLLAEVAERVAALERRVAAVERLGDRTAVQLLRHQTARGPQVHGDGLP
jgi:hypothetical protein